MRHGNGVTQDYAEALKWYRKAADEGEAGAQSEIGVMYNDGQGVTQDHAEALKWFRKAAEQGEARGLFNLGIAYSKGSGVPQDYVQAHMWFSLAALLASDKEDREGASKARDVLASEMSTVQIAEAQKLVREWWPKPER